MTTTDREFSVTFASATDSQLVDTYTFIDHSSMF